MEEVSRVLFWRKKEKKMSQVLFASLDLYPSLSAFSLVIFLTRERIFISNKLFISVPIYGVWTPLSYLHSLKHPLWEWSTHQEECVSHSLTANYEWEHLLSTFSSFEIVRFLFFLLIRGTLNMASRNTVWETLT